jgi:histone deacetylase 1/2
MENANSKDYLEKIKIQVIENLKKTAHAPSVQMTDVPRTTLIGGADDEDDVMDDLDDDENKDTRHTKRRWDQRITRDDELDESEDEEESRANGVQVQAGQPKRRNIMDFQNANAAASDVEMDSGIATPEVQHPVDGVVTAMATEANAEVNAELMEKKTLDVAAVDAGEAGPSNAPSRAQSAIPTVAATDGDVDMADAPDAPTEAKVEPAAEKAADVPEKEPEAPAPTETAAEPVATATDPVEAKQEGEAGRTDKDVEAEASTEVAAQPKP